jgi:hypothetical protein
MWTLAPHPQPVADFILGLSIGQVMEPTALAILRKDRALDGGGKPIQDAGGHDAYQFACVDLERFTGMSYPAIAAAVSAKLALPALQPREGQDSVLFALEITGVGKSVADLFIDARFPADLALITSTGGVETIRDCWIDRSGWAAAAAWFRVPKQDLVAVMLASLQAERLTFAGAMPLAKLLRQELHNFRATPARADELSGRNNVGDDLIFATAAALWLGNHHVPFDWSKTIL